MPGNVRKIKMFQLQSVIIPKDGSFGLVKIDKFEAVLFSQVLVSAIND